VSCKRSVLTMPQAIVAALEPPAPRKEKRKKGGCVVL
jgi:hypothetical protein